MTSNFAYIASASGAFTIGGFQQPTNGVGIIFIYNDTTAAMTLGNETATTTAANRITTGIGKGYRLTSGGSAQLMYSSPDQRWVLVAAFQGDYQTFAPAMSSYYSSLPTGTIYRYRFVGGDVLIEIREANNGTAAAVTTLGFTAPVPAAVSANNAWQGLAQVVDNGAIKTTPGRAVINQNSSAVTMYTDMASGAWTASAGKRIGFLQLQYPYA